MCQIKLIIINNNNNNDNNITFCLKCGIKDIFGSKNAKVQKLQKIYLLHSSEILCHDRDVGLYNPLYVG